MESKSTLAADDTIYHAVSATILYLTAQSKIQPLVYQSGIPYYSQEVFEKVLLEMFGQHLDCTGLLQPVQIETHEEEALFDMDYNESPPDPDNLLKTIDFSES